MHGDAGVAGAQHGVDAVEALQRRAAAARRAFVAGLGGVVEVIAAGPLQEIAGGSRLIAQLPGGAIQQRPGEHRITLAHPPVGREVGIGDGRANAQPALFGIGDLHERQA